MTKRNVYTQIHTKKDRLIEILECVPCPLEQAYRLKDQCRRCSFFGGLTRHEHQTKIVCKVDVDY